MAYTYKQRVLMAMSYAAMTSQYATLNAALEAAWAKHEKGAVPDNAYRHAKDWYDRLLQEGNVFSHRPKGHPIIPNDEALVAANLIKGGYTVEVKHKEGPPEVKHYYFTSIGHAIRTVPHLANMLKNYQVDKKYLLSRIHDVMPSLVWSKIDIKPAFSAAQRELRRKCARWFLNELQSNPNFLDEVVWIDQVKVWLFGGNDLSVNAWHDAHDKGFQAVVPCSGKISSTAMHVCIYVAVHAKLGLVFWQYVSGTVTGWKPMLWPGAHGEAERRDEDWKVSG